MTIRPRRSALYMRGSNARAIEKARTLPADAVILDLEDSVAPDAKEAAREQVVKAVKADGFGQREVFIRTNALDTPWGNDDLTAAAAAAPDAILVPKITTPGQVEMIGQRLLDTHTDLRTRLWVMIESPLAVLNAPAIAACATTRSRRERRRCARRRKSSPRSICRRTRTRAWWRSMAAWSSACMPRWHGGRWQSRKQLRPGRRLGRALARPNIGVRVCWVS